MLLGEAHELAGQPAPGTSGIDGKHAEPARLSIKRAELQGCLNVPVDARDTDLTAGDRSGGFGRRRAGVPLAPQPSLRSLIGTVDQIADETD
jgi:hypothetical protein